MRIARWARATIAADPQLRQATRQEQVARFARVMPPTLAGRHAVSHIESALDWQDRRPQFKRPADLKAEREVLASAVTTRRRSPARWPPFPRLARSSPPLRRWRPAQVRSEVRCLREHASSADLSRQ